MNNPPTIRDRVIDIRQVKASELVPNPKNFRVHPEAQRDAYRGLLAEIGDVGAVVARELPDGRLMLIDGHMRKAERGEDIVRVFVTDLTEQEADKLLAALDPMTMMAQHDGVKLAELLGGVDAESDGLRNMFEGLLDQAEFAAIQDSSLDADPKSKGKKSADRMGDKKKQIKPVLYSEQIEIFEKALHKTGQMNRAEALMEICNAYLAKEQK